MLSFFWHLMASPFHKCTGSARIQEILENAEDESFDATYAPLPGDSSPGPLVALWKARHRTCLPTSLSATDEKHWDYPKLHTSFLELRTRRRKHCRAEPDEMQASRPKGLPMLSSKQVGLHPPGPQGVRFDRVTSPISRFHAQLRLSKWSG